jgi:hypothetical protein
VICNEDSHDQEDENQSCQKQPEFMRGRRHSAVRGCSDCCPSLGYEAGDSENTRVAIRVQRRYAEIEEAEIDRLRRNQREGGRASDQKARPDDSIVGGSTSPGSRRRHRKHASSQAEIHGVTAKQTAIRLRTAQKIRPRDVGAGLTRVLAPTHLTSEST